MSISLTENEKIDLEKRHRKERDGRIRDRIKAILLHAEGWTGDQIAQALRIHPETVYEHLKNYRQEKKLEPCSGGSQSILNQAQTKELISHLEGHTYAKVKDICYYVNQTYKVSYSIPGMNKWLHHHEFSYKKPHGIPAKADPEKQAEFIEFYNTLLNTTSENEPIEFGDGVHPTMATKIAYGWIRKGMDKPIQTIASRTRLNYFGSINLETMKMVIDSYETINSSSMEEHFKKLRERYPEVPYIHLILDRGPYNTSYDTAEAAKKYRIKLHFLPPYSPNLNPMERVWKVTNEYVRDNRVFQSATQFKQEIDNFFYNKWNKICHSLTDRITDNFQILRPVFSG